MRKVAPLIIFEWIQFSGRTHSSRNHEALLAKQNVEVTAKMSLSGSVLIKTTLYEALAEVLWCTQTVFLSKQVPTIVAGKRRDTQTIEILGAYTLKGYLVL